MEGDVGLVCPAHVNLDDDDGPDQHVGDGEEHLVYLSETNLGRFAYLERGLRIAGVVEKASNGAHLRPDFTDDPAPWRHIDRLGDDVDVVREVCHFAIGASEPCRL